MNTHAHLSRLLRPFTQKINDLVMRAVVKSVTDSQGKLQVLRVQVGADGEELSKVERVQNFGLTSNPPAGAQVALLCLGGDTARPLAVAVDSAAQRPASAAGETVLYNGANGCTVKLNADGSITLTPAAGRKITLASDVDVTGTLKASVDVQAGAVAPKSLLLHVHPGVTVGPGVSGPPQ